MMTAKEWGIPPHEWDLTPKKARAEMMAVSQVTTLIEAFQYENRKTPEDA